MADLFKAAITKDRSRIGVMERIVAEIEGRKA